MAKFVCPICLSEYSKSEIKYVCPVCKQESTKGLFEREPVKCKTAGCNGHATLRTCPKCGEVLPRESIETDNLTFSIVGVAASGKTNYITTMMHELRDVPGISVMPENEETRRSYDQNCSLVYEKHVKLQGTHAGSNTPQIWCIKNIKKNIVWIAAMGAIYGLACNIGLLMEGPISLTQLSEGDKANAVATTVARALSFIPLKGLTSLTTGTFVTDGFGFTATAGLVAPNPALAAVFGAIVMSLEALSLLLIAKLFDKFPGVKKSADSMRVSMTKLLEIALLAGSVVAAGNMAGGLGYFVVAAFYAMNEYFKKPITRLAVGPIATIFVALLVNLFSVIGLFAV